jgi:hypothetical protein
LCTVTDGDQTATTRLSADAPATATLGDYRVQFSIVLDPERGRVLRADLYALRDPTTEFNPNLPPGVIARAETSFTDRSPQLQFVFPHVRGNCQ